jgi:membrane associated rhomboid family serine protease
MLFPYSTDAPIYHWPIATVGLIAANIIAFVGVWFGNLGPIENWILAYGDGLHPQQWLSAMFMHNDPMHLIGNMLFLWVFGIIVEGKLGWWKFLAGYLFIGLAENMFNQWSMLDYAGDVPGALGASAAIFGLVGMAAVWAPLNEIRFMWILYNRSGDFDIPIYIMAVIYTGFEMLSLLQSGGALGSSWLHLTGLVLGIPPAIALLKLGLVDCEGWDLFHVIRGEYGSDKKEPTPEEVFAKVDARQRRRDEGQRNSANEQFKLYVAQGNYAAALKLRDKMKDVAGGLVLERTQLLGLVKWLHGEKRWRDSAPIMAELIDRFPEQSDSIRIKLAQICLVELSRPGKALDLLEGVDNSQLPGEQSALVKKIVAKARQLQHEGVVELDVDTW